MVEVVEAPVPRIGPGEVLVRMEACGICGTDLMKVYTPSVAKPVQLGHEVVGTVVELGADVRQVEMGQRVAVLHHVPDFSSHYTRRGSAPMDPLFRRSNLDPAGFAEFIRVPALQVQHALLPLPEAMPTLRAVFVEPLACCLRLLDRSNILEGDTVLIVGAGAVGLLFTPLLRQRSATVVVCDVRRERIDLALDWGAVAGFAADVQEVAAGVRSVSQGRGADMVVLTVLSQATLELALAAVRDGGVIGLFGVKPDTTANLDFWQLWRREVSLVSSYSATPDLLPRALTILQQQEMAFERTISHCLPLQETARGFDLAHAGTASKVVITPE